METLTTAETSILIRIVSAVIVAITDEVCIDAPAVITGEQIAIACAIRLTADVLWFIRIVFAVIVSITVPRCGHASVSRKTPKRTWEEIECCQQQQRQKRLVIFKMPQNIWFIYIYKDETQTMKYIETQFQ